LLITRNTLQFNTARRGSRLRCLKRLV
jgi:hypothetical protein